MNFIKLVLGGPRTSNLFLFNCVLLALLAVKSAEMVMTGGTSEVKIGDPEAQEVADLVKTQVEEKTGQTYPIFNVETYKTQLVAGKNYFLKAS